MKNHPAQRRGYILFETVLALSVLSVSMLFINAGMRQTILVRAQTRDYTQVRFLLETLMAKIELQPQLAIGTHSGAFKGHNQRFKWKYEVSKVDLPLPPLPPDLPPEEAEEIQLNAPHLAKIVVTITWKRGGQAFKEAAETLCKTDKIFVPKEDGA